MIGKVTSLEICAGGGGQALGLEIAGFEHVAVVEIDEAACDTLRSNRPSWNVIQGDVRSFDGRPFHGVDLLAGGVPCPPFSIAGKQLGAEDERDLFPEALRLVAETNPRAVMLENVRGLSSPKFSAYRASIISRLSELGYRADWRLLHASDFGVSQLRPRFILIAIRMDVFHGFEWPTKRPQPQTVGEALQDMMASRGWSGAVQWARKADGIAPTVVGGSKKHGGPDLGPTRARLQWKQLGVDGLGIAAEPPSADFPVDGTPKLTVQMVARIQGFPDDWCFTGRKTRAYRQVGNAFPPPVATAVGQSILNALSCPKRIAPPGAGLTGLPLIDLIQPPAI